MPVYRCKVQGVNFPGSILDIDVPIGFYATYLVEADNVDSARAKLLGQLREDPLLANHLEEPTTGATVVIEDVCEAPAGAGSIKLTWFLCG